MNSADFIIALAVAVVCGTVAQMTSGYSKGGWIVNLIMGYLGALAGVVVSRALNAPVIYNLDIRNTSFPLIYCLIGSVLFVAAISFFVKPSRR